MQVFRSDWQLNLAELQTEFILGERFVLERGNITIAAFNLHVSSGALFLAFKMMSFRGS